MTNRYSVTARGQVLPPALTELPAFPDADVAVEHAYTLSEQYPSTLFALFNDHGICLAFFWNGHKYELFVDDL